jgi:hypothetical protein
MSQRAVTITSLPMAFEVVKAMQAEGLEWSEGFRALGRQALGHGMRFYMIRQVMPRGSTMSVITVTSSFARCMTPASCHVTRPSHRVFKRFAVGLIACWPEQLI